MLRRNRSRLGLISLSLLRRRRHFANVARNVNAPTQCACDAQRAPSVATTKRRLCVSASARPKEREGEKTSHLRATLNLTLTLMMCRRRRLRSAGSSRLALSVRARWADVADAPPDLTVRSSINQPNERTNEESATAPMRSPPPALTLPVPCLPFPSRRVSSWLVSTRSDFAQRPTHRLAPTCTHSSRELNFDRADGLIPLPVRNCNPANLRARARDKARKRTRTGEHCCQRTVIGRRTFAYL